MAVEINGEVFEHEKPTKYSELVHEYVTKSKQLKQLQKEVDELSSIILALDKAVESTRTPIGNYTITIDYDDECKPG